MGGIITAMTRSQEHPELKKLAIDISQWGEELGFQQVSISDTELEVTGRQHEAWLAAGYSAEMEYMSRHGEKRYRPELLVPGTLRVITARMDYLPINAVEPTVVLDEPQMGYISRYALGRDYHKLMRKRLQQLAKRIEECIGGFGYRIFVDSAPVMEKALASKAGLGWTGKHSNLLSRDAGSWFFLGEIYTDLPLPVGQPVAEHCGRCTACIDLCPTSAIVEPYQVDARLCISYLTIEHPGTIPVGLRPLFGNRIYGCDDCQLVCPWNRFANKSSEEDFLPRNGLDAPQLVELFGWSEKQFLKKMEGSPIRRIGHERWLRNIAVALGNSSSTPVVIKALKKWENHHSAIVREHIIWALEQQGNRE